MFDYMFTTKEEQELVGRIVRIDVNDTCPVCKTNVGLVFWEVYDTRAGDMKRFCHDCVPTGDHQLSFLYQIFGRENVNILSRHELEARNSDHIDIQQVEW